MFLQSLSRTPVTPSTTSTELAVHGEYNSTIRLHWMYLAVNRVL
jgi:hypothetical protein